VVVRTLARAKGWWIDLRRHASREFGATSVEYAIMIGLIAAVIILGVAFLGRSTSAGFDSVRFP